MDIIKEQILASFYESFYRYMGGDSGDRTKEIHVTDLCALCIRASFFGKKNPGIFSLTSAMRMVIGSKMHEIPIFGEKGKHEIPVEWEGIMGRIDEWYNGVIVDKKTTRNIPKSPSDYVTNQLRYYRVMGTHNNLPVKSAYVLYFDVDNAYAACYAVDISGELELIEGEMIVKKEELSKALESNVPPARNMGWWCKTCLFATQCFQPGAVAHLAVESEVPGGD